MDQIIQYIDNLSSFEQNLLAPAVFMLGVVLLRALLKLLKFGGKSSVRIYSKTAVLKHIIYKNYVSSSRMADFTWGYMFVLCQVLQYLVLAAGILVFIFGVKAFLDSEWFIFIGYFIAFNYIFEANSWLQDWSSEKKIRMIDEEIKKEMLPEENTQAELTNETKENG